MNEIQVEDLPQQNRPSDASEATQTDNKLHLLLSRRFNIDTASKEEDGKLKEVWDYAYEKASSDNPQDILWEVMHLQNTLGAPRLGESPLDKVYRWAKLKRQQKQIESELRNV